MKAPTYGTSHASDDEKTIHAVGEAQLKIAIVYYSRTKTTQKIAQILARKVKADLFEIKSNLYPLGLRGYLRALKHAFQKDAEPLEVHKWNLNQYDLIIIGTPVWASHISAPVRSFLLSYSRKIRNAAFFTTCSGSGGDKVIQRMSEISRLTPIANLVFTARDISPPRLEQKIAGFERELVQFEARLKSPEPSPSL